MKKTSKWVVDTNVPVVANARTDGSRSPSLECRLAAIEFLEDILINGCVFLDLAGNIQAEYRSHLNSSGQPGVGDLFYLQILNSRPGHVERVDLPVGLDGEYVDLPRSLLKAGFDPSDRKFAALARRSKAPVVNAVDSDWIISKEILKSCNIKIKNICGCDTTKWFL